MVKGKRQKKEKLIVVCRDVFGFPNNKREFMVEPELKKYVLWLAEKFAIEAVAHDSLKDKIKDLVK